MRTDMHDSHVGIGVRQKAATIYQATNIKPTARPIAIMLETTAHIASAFIARLL